MEEINNFQQEPDESLLRGWERFKELLMKCPHHYLTDMLEVILFYNGLNVPTRQILDSKGAIPTKIAADAKIAIQEMAEYSQKWHNGTSSKARRPHYTKDCPLKEEGETPEEAYYTQFGAPYQPAKRHEENSNIIKEIRASTDAAIRNQRASIKTLEIQFGQMSKVLQERGIGGLPDSTEPNPRDHVKSISTAKANSSAIRHIESGPYAVHEVRILETYDHTLPQKEKDPGSFTLPCFIHDICFDKSLVDLGASVSVMPFSTYSNLGLDKGDHEGKNLAGTLIDIPIFVGNFSIISSFSITDDVDITSGVMLGMLFCKKIVSCQKIMERFAHGDECERMDE
ncbi:NUDIX hydrolase 6-like protein [Tanacetum coccineum]